MGRNDKSSKQKFVPLPPAVGKRPMEELFAAYDKLRSGEYRHPDVGSILAPFDYVRMWENPRLYHIQQVAMEKADSDFTGRRFRFRILVQEWFPAHYSCTDHELLVFAEAYLIRFAGLWYFRVDSVVEESRKFREGLERKKRLDKMKASIRKRYRGLKC